MRSAWLPSHKGRFKASTFAPRETFRRRRAGPHLGFLRDTSGEWPKTPTICPETSPTLRCRQRPFPAKVSGLNITAQRRHDAWMSPTNKSWRGHNKMSPDFSAQFRPRYVWNDDTLLSAWWWAMYWPWTAGICSMANDHIWSSERLLP